jgi:hypothetical protein
LLENLDKSAFYSALSLTKLVEYLKGTLLTLVKMILMESKIIVYSQQSAKVTTFVLSLLGLFPGCNNFNYQGSTSLESYMVKFVILIV